MACYTLREKKYSFLPTTENMIHHGIKCLLGRRYHAGSLEKFICYDEPLKAFTHWNSKVTRFFLVETGPEYDQEDGYVYTSSIILIREMCEEERKKLLSGWLVRKNGVKMHYYNGVLHHARKPAVIYPDGFKLWYNNGELMTYR